MTDLPSLLQYYAHANACLTSWLTLMAYFVLSPNGEETLNTFLSPDPDPNTDHPREGPSDEHNTSCVKNQVNRCNSFSLRARTDTHAVRSQSSLGARVMK